MTTTVGHVGSRRRLTSMGADVVYIGRPSKWGNPFMIGKDGTRSQVIAQYEQWLEQHPELIAAAKVELQNKILLCYCHPMACHGDVLARIVNEQVD